MIQELMMENVWVPVPFLVLSTQVDRKGQMEKHILTPFGYMDIAFPALHEEHRRPEVPYEVTVRSDFDGWNPGTEGPVEFRQYLLNYVREIVELYLGRAELNQIQLRIHFANGDQSLVHAMRTEPAGHAGCPSMVH